jgi:5-methyltetrahydropteroyltriglutamate--homocysteine methyltransferase
MFETAIAGSLPKPSWLAETEKLWPEWKSSGAELERAKADATLLWLKVQEDAGIDVVGDGEQSRQHFVHGFLAKVEGIDFEHKVKMGIRDNRYDAMVPQVVGPLRLSGRVHATEARLARAHTGKRLKFTLPGPMTIVDTVADRYYGSGKEGRIRMAYAFAELLNQEARALEADGVDIIQFDEPAFNVYMADAAEWGVGALERAAEGLGCKTRSTSATATASRRTSTGSRASATSGASTSRCFRRSRKAGSIRSRSSATTRTCRPS